MPLVHYYTLQAYLLNYPNTYLDGRDIHDVQQEGISNQAFGDYYESLYFTVNSHNQVQFHLSLVFYTSALTIPLRLNTFF